MSWSIEAVREAAVEPAAVFALYADPSTWSQWGHNAPWAQADGPMVEGGIVRVRANYRAIYRCRIRRFEAGRALELVVRPFGLTIINTYEVEPSLNGARIRHALELSGPLAGIIRRLGAGRMYQPQLVEEVLAVIRLAADPGSVAPGPRAITRVSLPERIWHGIGRLLRGGRAEQRG